MTGIPRLLTVICRPFGRDVSRRANREQRVVVQVEQLGGLLSLDLTVTLEGAITLTAEEAKHLRPSRTLLDAVVLIDEDAPNGFGPVELRAVNRQDGHAEADPEYDSGYDMGHRHGGEIAKVNSDYYLSTHGARWREGYRAGLCASMTDYLKIVNKEIAKAAERDRQNQASYYSQPLT